MVNRAVWNPKGFGAVRVIGYTHCGLSPTFHRALRREKTKRPDRSRIEEGVRHLKVPRAVCAEARVGEVWART